MSNPEPLRAPVVRTLVGQVVSNKMQKTLCYGGTHGSTSKIRKNHEKAL